MDRQEGMDILSQRGWLAGTPSEFRSFMIDRSQWQEVEAGTQIQAGGEESGDIIGLASGIIELRSIQGRSDTPIMHFARPVFWIGYSSVAFDHRPHKVEATASTKVWLARVPIGPLKKLLVENPTYWQCFLRPAFFFADIALNVAADLLIRDSSRRCSAVLLRLSGRRFEESGESDQVEVLVTQDDLASAANLSRTSVRSILQRLATRGLIKQSYRGIIISDFGALRAFVDEV